MITWPIFAGLFIALILIYYSNKRENEKENNEE